MMLLFVTILAVIIFTVFVEDYIEDDKWYVYWGLCAVLILMSGLRPVGMDPDSLSYEQTFSNIDDPMVALLFEYSFIVICQVGKSIMDDVHIVFFTYALIAISIRFVAIKRLTPLVFLSLAVYLGNFYILHDFTQLRVSIASSIFLLAIPDLCEGRKRRVFVMMLIALFFHYSSLALFVMLFLSNQELTKRWRIGLACIVPVGIVMLLLHIDLITILPIPFIQEKLERYQLLQEYTDLFEEASLVNAFLWIKIIIFLYALYFYDTIKENCPYLPLLLKIMGLSLLAYFGLSQLPVVGGRISELFGVTEIILFPYAIYYTIKPTILAKSLICLLAIIEFTFNIYIWKLLDFTVS